jgi:hypothetical protein
MTTYYVATLARYVLVDADDESDARERGHAALLHLYADDGRAGAAINIRTVRPATDDEIELWRWHHEMVASELGERLVDPALQAKTDWTPMSVPGRENADGTETPTAWFAFNRATRQSIRFPDLDEAKAFCFHPENRR